MPTMTQEQIAAAAQIRAGLEAAVNRARADDTLSTVGRQRHIARAYKAAETEMAGIRINHAGGAAVTAEHLQRELFGADQVAGTDAISVRDAEDRAAQLQSGGEALALLRRAERNNDQVLARAVAAKAFEAAQDFIGGAAWSPVIDAYTETRPDIAGKLQQLVDTQRNGVSDAINSAGWTWLGKPDELARVSEGQLEALTVDDNPTAPTLEGPPPARVGGTYA
jgi:hypothetical protein